MTLKEPHIPKDTLSGGVPLKVARMAVVRLPSLFFILSAEMTLGYVKSGSSGKAMG